VTIGKVSDAGSSTSVVINSYWAALGEAAFVLHGEGEHKKAIIRGRVRLNPIAIEEVGAGVIEGPVGKTVERAFFFDIPEDATVTCDNPLVKLQKAFRR
jgi:hypothetical protein